MEQLEIRDPENLLAEIRAELMKQNAQEKERILFQKLTFGALVFLVILIAAVAIFCAGPLNGVIEGVNAATKVLSDADVDGALGSIQEFAKQGADTFAAVETTVSDSAKVLDALDVQTLNAAIQQLNNAAAGFSELDFAKLNEAITNLNATIEPMAKFFGVFKKS